MVCSTRVFDVVGVIAGRGEGRCWPLPVSMGLAFRVFDDVVHSLAEVWVVVLACSWPFLVSMGWAFRVFDDVGAVAGR